MKNLLLIFTLLLLCANALAQSNIKMQSVFGSKDNDLTSILYFEDIGLEKVTFTGSDLKGKDYQIWVKEYTKGKLTKNEIVFDSKDSDQFRIQSDEFVFRALSKRTSENTVKFRFQFNGFAMVKEYKIEASDKDFALKSFVGAEPDIPIPLNKSTYILTYLMPYARKDGSTSYCEVAQSGGNPEEFGTKYEIPRYFLFDIKFQ